jgi:energy-coupling factor transporter transmembrane protein EcfT
MIKKSTLLFLFTSLLMFGCVYELPPVFYRFVIENNTADTLFLEYQMKGELLNNYDTIYINHEFEKELFELGAYDQNNDTLFNAFFIQIKANFCGKMIVVPLNKSKWVEEKIKKADGNETICFKYRISNVNSK